MYVFDFIEFHEKFFYFLKTHGEKIFIKKLHTEQEHTCFLLVTYVLLFHDFLKLYRKQHTALAKVNPLKLESPT